ncbi:MAG TPA: acyl-CoA dehydrogenase family protein [Actinomycetota bacterium]|nr:acyl-CoA dehydrogenase family protein [Actinomycetota bacterium]
MRWTLEDTPEQAAFRDGFRSWLRDNAPDEWVDAVEAGDEERFTQIRKGFDVMRWMRTIGESGYAAPLWPREYGGMSGEVWMQQVVREELASYRLPLIGINILGVGLAGPTLIAHGTDEQKQRYLRKILTGEEIWCQLFSEPGSGSDLASLGTRAERVGDDWVINGQKVWTSIAQFSKYGMLLARHDPTLPKHAGLTYFIVEMQAPGVEVRPLRQITGSAEFSEVYFTDVRVPDTNRVGEIGQGWEVARTTLMNERVALSGISTGMESFTGGARRDPWQAFLETLPDRDDPVVRQRIAQVWIDQQAKEITSFRAAVARRAGTPGAEGGVLKVFNAEFNQRRTNLAMNAAGARAIAWLPGDDKAENRAHGFLRARANTIEGGTSEVLRNQMAERILGLPRDAAVDKDLPWKDIRRS